jgi:hypothetical protein
MELALVLGAVRVAAVQTKLSLITVSKPLKNRLWTKFAA